MDYFVKLWPLFLGLGGILASIVIMKNTTERNDKKIEVLEKSVNDNKTDILIVKKDQETISLRVDNLEYDYDELKKDVKEILRTMNLLDKKIDIFISNCKQGKC